MNVLDYIRKEENTVHPTNTEPKLSCPHQWQIVKRLNADGETTSDVFILFSRDLKKGNRDDGLLAAIKTRCHNCIDQSFTCYFLDASEVTVI